MKLQKLIIVAIFMLSLTVNACKETDTTEKEPAMDMTNLIGDWTLTDATINGKKRNSLDDATFSFVDDKTLTISVGDIPGVNADEVTPYTLDNQTIKDVGSFKLNFEITTLDAKKMTLQSEIQGMDCNFVFQK